MGGKQHHKKKPKPAQAQMVQPMNPLPPVRGGSWLPLCTGDEKEVESYFQFLQEQSGRSSKEAVTNLAVLLWVSHWNLQQSGFRLLSMEKDGFSELPSMVDWWKKTPACSKEPHRKAVPKIQHQGLLGLLAKWSLNVPNVSTERVEEASLAWLWLLAEDGRRGYDIIAAHESVVQFRRETPKKPPALAFTDSFDKLVSLQAPKVIFFPPLQELTIEKILDPSERARLLERVQLKITSQANDELH